MMKNMWSDDQCACKSPPDLTSEQLYSYLKDSPDSRYIVLAKRLSYDTIQPFVNLQEERDEKENWLIHISKVFGLKKEYQRQYPYENWQSSVIGFTTSGNLGINGLENYYDDTLNGINGRQYGYLNSDSNFEKTIKLSSQRQYVSDNDRCDDPVGGREENTGV